MNPKSKPESASAIGCISLSTSSGRATGIEECERKVTLV